MTNREKADLFCKDWLEGKQLFTVQTSGSTGPPKTIGLRRDQMIASARNTIKALDLKEGMTALVCLDVDFIAGKMMLVRCLVGGMKMVVVEPKANPLEGLPPMKIDFAALVPYQLNAIFLDSRLRDIGKIIIGGAPLSDRTAISVSFLMNPSIYATFGMTETITHIALRRLNGPGSQDFYEVLDGVHISLDERDCLVIDADYLDDTVITNDVVELIDPRRFRWLGRWDDVINSGGIKTFPYEIEAVVHNFLDPQDIFNRYFVAGIQHEKLGEQIVLVIEGLLSENDEAGLMEHLRTTLKQYKVPRQILYVDKFAMTPTQKINRKLSLENALPRPSGR